MKRVDNKKNLYKSIILLVILAIGIGYAYLTSNLSITGATEVVANTWDIHFDNLIVTNGSVTASTPAEIDSSETSIEYAITLSRPKEYYEFTVDVVNEGTLPGKVSLSELSGLDATSSKVIDYSIKYTYGQPVNVGDILNGGATKTIKVRVYYKDDITEDDFPDNNLNLNLTYTLQYVQSDEDEVTIDDMIQNLKTNNSTCFTKYTGEVTDRVGVTAEATNVYFDECEDKGSIIFNNICWRAIRTTETGGLKMIYNGEPVDGKCLNDRDDHKGIVGNVSDSYIETTVGNYLYGSSFTYDLLTNEFKIMNTTTSYWSDSTYQNLIGKFTCKSTSDTCTTLYSVNGYYDSTRAYILSYKIDNTNYAQIGTSSFNANKYSPSMVGYMFNKVYNNKLSTPSSNSLFGNDVSYSNGVYTLLPADGESELGTVKDDAHHYTCNTTSSTCTKVRYYFSSIFYIELDGVENVQAVINEMFYNNDVNKYNSSIKGIIDNWYAQNLSSKTNMLEDTIFCNNRLITSIGGWDPDGGSGLTDMNIGGSISNMTCSYETDQFAVGNNKARLTYPVGLLTIGETYYMNHSLLDSDYYWLLSPSIFANGGSDYGAYVRGLLPNGTFTTFVSHLRGIRPVVSLASYANISKGTGSKSDPWVVE